MRLSVIAGLIMGMSLALLSLHDARAQAALAQALSLRPTSAPSRPAHTVAPWFVAQESVVPKQT